jgi:cell division protein FtsN
MRTLCLLLLLVNVATFGWQFDQILYPAASDRPAPSLPAISPDVPVLRLLSELSAPLPKRDQPGKTLSPVNSRGVEAVAPPEEHPATPPPPAAEKIVEASPASNTAAIPTAPDASSPEAVAPAPAPAPAPEVVAPAPAPVPASEVPPPAPACYTLGPFADQEQRTQIRQSLASQLQRVHERDELPEPNRQWVYLGPYASSAAAEEQVTALKAKGVEDMFVVKQGANKNTISLGLFKEKTSVTERVKELKALGYEAHVEPRYETQPRYWLDVAVDAAQVSPSTLQEALPGSAQTKATDCGKIAEAGAAQ